MNPTRGAMLTGSNAEDATAWPAGLSTRFVLAGAWVGINDLAFAIAIWSGVYRRVGPVRILKAIATGVLGPAALDGGAATAALGLFLHFTVAFGWTAVFLAALVAWPALRARVIPPVGAVIVGLLYGAFVWLAMDFVVLPLSRSDPTPVRAPWFWMQLVQHPLLVGLPIVWVLSGAWRTRSATGPQG